jgi:hypothetical protein
MFHRTIPASIRLAVTATLFLLLASCEKEKEGPVYRVIGEAFAGPNELAIRQDVSLRSPVVAKAKHGEKLEILDRRRRMVQVRNQAQVVGWVDMRLLISETQMEALDALAQEFKNAPSMGRATVFDVLNVHTDPNRYAPTFLQVQEGEHVEVIGHRVVRREPFQGKGLDLEDDTPQPVVKKKRPKKEPKFEPPPPPPAPKVPDNWLELSRTPKAEVPPVVAAERAVDEKGKKKKKGPVVLVPPPTQPMDDLSLIRTKSGRVGWVLTNGLFLEVPDEVAQYAEGNRITSYFSLGEVDDEGKKQHHWLWTTQGHKYAPFEFDGFRVFTYNTRRHRHETAYRERDFKGYYPVLVDRSKAQPEFSIVMEDAAGEFWLKSYAFDGTRVRSLGKKPYVPVKSLPQMSTKIAPAKPAQSEGWWDRLSKLWK